LVFPKIVNFVKMTQKKPALHTQAVTSVEDGGDVEFPAQAAHAALPAAGL
jgi:hypothetical protein